MSDNHGMRFLIVALLLALPTSATEREVLAEVAAFARAFERGDADALAAKLTPSYTHTNGGSTPIGRDAWLGFIRTRAQQLAAGTLKLTKYENSDLAVTIHGKTAIVTGVNLSEGTRDGTPFRTRLRFTQVWTRTRGGWRRAAFHDAVAQ